MFTSSSSPTYPTTQRENAVHPAHLQAHHVDKLRHQESLWRKDPQSGGNPRTTTPTGTVIWHANGSMTSFSVGTKYKKNWTVSKDPAPMVELSLTDEMVPQYGRRYEASGMEAAKTMAEADVVL